MKSYIQSSTPTPSMFSFDIGERLAQADGANVNYTVHTGTDAERLAIADPELFDVFICVDTGTWYRFNHEWAEIARNGVPVIGQVTSGHAFSLAFNQAEFK